MAAPRQRAPGWPTPNWRPHCKPLPAAVRRRSTAARWRVTSWPRCAATPCAQAASRWTTWPATRPRCASRCAPPTACSSGCAACPRPARAASPRCKPWACWNALTWRPCHPTARTRCIWCPRPTAWPMPTAPSTSPMPILWPCPWPVCWSPPTWCSGPASSAPPARWACPRRAGPAVRRRPAAPMHRPSCLPPAMCPSWTARATPSA